MSELRKIFDSLPTPSSVKSIRAAKLRNFSNKIWICKDKKKQPVILLKSSDKFLKQNVPPISLNNIEISHCQKRIVETGSKRDEIFCSIITCKSNDEDLLDLFFDVLDTLFKKFSFPVEPKKIKELLEKLVKLFESIKNAPKKSIQGLWAELFLIYRSNNHAKVIECWHKETKAKYDFQNQKNFLEVKSTIQQERKHAFSLEQAQVKEGQNVIIASLLLEPDDDGLTIKNLEMLIKNKIKNRSDLIEELIYQIRSTLGTDWKKGNQDRFSESFASSNLKFFDLKDIPKLDEKVKTRGVEKIKFTSNLDFAPEVKKSIFKAKSSLYRAAL